MSDDHFLNLVDSDLTAFLDASFGKNAVLIFPPVRNRFRFLIHNLIQQEYSHLLETISVGQDRDRRTTVFFRRRSQPSKNSGMNCNQPTQKSDSDSVGSSGEAGPKDRKSKSSRPTVQTYVPPPQRNRKITLSSPLSGGTPEPPIAQSLAPQMVSGAPRPRSPRITDGTALKSVLPNQRNRKIRLISPPITGNLESSVAVATSSGHGRGVEGGPKGSSRVGGGTVMQLSQEPLEVGESSHDNPQACQYSGKSQEPESHQQSSKEPFLPSNLPGNFSERVSVPLDLNTVREPSQDQIVPCEPPEQCPQPRTSENLHESAKESETPCKSCPSPEPSLSCLDELKRDSPKAPRCDSLRRIALQAYPEEETFIVTSSSRLPENVIKILRRPDTSGGPKTSSVRHSPLPASVLEDLTVAFDDASLHCIPQSSYKNYSPVDSVDGFLHVVEIYDFPKSYSSNELSKDLKMMTLEVFDIRWVDDTHALGVFGSEAAARAVLSVQSPLVKTKLRPLAEASEQARRKARESVQCDVLTPFKQRPETNVAAARRMVAGALGMKVNVPQEKREQERQQLLEAKEKKVRVIKQKNDAWDGYES